MRNLILLSVLIFAPAPSCSEDVADVVLRNGRFYPVSPSEVVVGSLAIRDGRIHSLGTGEAIDALIDETTRVIELEGRAVTPGLIDAHAHLMSQGRALAQVSLVGTRSYAEVIERISRAARDVPSGDWIIGRGWDQNDWESAAFPHHEKLSLAIADHPVWMGRIDGHAALLNAAAMARLGVSADIVDPAGGRFLRDPDGQPTGVLVDSAMDSVRSGIPEPSNAQLKRWIVDGAEHCLARGLTTVTDMGVDQSTYQAYADLRQQTALPLRAALFLEDEPALLDDWFERGPEIDSESRLIVRGVKLYADGALGSRGAALIEAYNDDPGNLGLLIASSAHLEDTCKRALAAGFQVGIHAIGDRGSLVSLDAIESCFGGPLPQARFRLEHAQVMRLRDIDRLAHLGVIASMQPTHATSDMPWAEQRTGIARLEGAYAWRRVLKAGALLALGSDFPVELADPLLGFYAAVGRQDLDGRPAGGWRPEERLTRQEALRGFTLDAAHALFLEEEIGSLEPGKRADLTVFSRDPMTVALSEIPAIEVDFTFVDGRIAYEREVQQ
ncbi:MAG: amidohydrolase [Acidobacteriota bacterium]|nr:amidohydrolase [Acidobacteriota bacterium]